MSLTLTVTQHWDDGKRLHVIGTVAATGNYVTGGVALDLSDFKIKDPSVPLFVLITGKNGYSYSYIPGTTRANGLVKVNTTAATELTQAAFPAGVTGDSINLYAIFHKLV